MKENMFDRVANKYDSEKQIDLAKTIVEEVQKELTNSQSKTLLEYGSGTGLVGLSFADQVGHLLLVDASKQMTDMAQAKISEQALENCEAIWADYLEEAPNVQVDIVLVSLVLLHIPQTKLILQRLYDILSEEGQLIIVDFDENDRVSHPKVHSGFSHEYIRSILEEIGYRSTKIRTFYEGEGLFMKQDASMFIACAIK